MKLNMFKRVCLTVMGVGVISSLVSVGTFATFTATTTNPGNTFAAGVLTITDVTAGAAQATGPNITSTAANALLGTGSDCTAALASACKQLIKTVNVASAGMEPGQYVEGTITLTNPAGNLPGVFAVQVQNVTSTANTTNCPSDIDNAGGPGAGACSKLGLGLNISIEDNNGPSGTQCIYGKASTPAATGGAAYFKAVNGACDDITGAALTAPVAANDPFGIATSRGLGTAG